MTHGHSLDPFRGFFYVSESVGFTTNSQDFVETQKGMPWDLSLAPLLGGWLGLRGFFYASESWGCFLTANGWPICGRNDFLSP